jgi:hypothetical protein
MTFNNLEDAVNYIKKHPGTYVKSTNPERVTKSGNTFINVYAPFTVQKYP